MGCKTARKKRMNKGAVSTGQTTPSRDNTHQNVNQGAGVDPGNDIVADNAPPSGPVIFNPIRRGNLENIDHAFDQHSHHRNLPSEGMDPGKGEEKTNQLIPDQASTVLFA